MDDEMSAGGNIPFHVAFCQCIHQLCIHSPTSGQIKVFKSELRFKFHVHFGWAETNVYCQIKCQQDMEIAFRARLLWYCNYLSYGNVNFLRLAANVTEVLYKSMSIKWRINLIIKFNQFQLQTKCTSLSENSSFALHSTKCIHCRYCIDFREQF